MNAPHVAEAARIAQNLARNRGWPVFPCSWETKTPSRPKRDDGRGYLDATTDPEKIAELWRRWPGALVGIATGAVSGISVLDIDVKADAARAWWRQNVHRLPTTRVYRTRSGGAHAYFRHAPGVRCTAGKPVPGIDVRGDGGYVICWFAAGLECLDHTPPAPWPAWLTTFFWPPPPPPAARQASGSPESAVSGIIRAVRNADEGSRNSILFWAANRLRERGINRGEAEADLLGAACAAGLPAVESARTVASAWGVR